jgi:hypothetical protein
MLSGTLQPQTTRSQKNSTVYGVRCAFRLALRLYCMEKDTLCITLTMQHLTSHMADPGGRAV